MILTTTHTVEGKTISEYLDVVFSPGTDFSEAAQAMREVANGLGADAIVGIHMATSIGQASGFLQSIAEGEELVICMIGTAVKLK